jgi:hypothetical protein
LFYAVRGPDLILAQPVAIEVEDDVEVVATPAPGAATAPAVQTDPPPTAAPVLPPPTAAAPVASADVKALADRVAALEARLAEESAKKAAPAVPEPVAPPAPVVPSGRGLNGVDPWLGLNWSGFVQAQYESNQLSENQVLPDGTPKNHKRFLVRRARLRMQRQWTYAGLDIEFDANTVRAPELSMRRLAAQLYWPTDDPSVLPYLRGQAGLLDIPFGHELPAGIRERLFSERSVASLAFFPSEADIGATIDGGYGPLRYAVAVMNGVEADGAYRLRDPNSGKDLLLRVGLDTGVSPELRISGGVSFVNGTGFHRGANATKNTLQWNDINEDGSKTDAEISGVPGRAADPSEDFSRWGVALDARVGWHSTLGWTWL